VSAPAGSYFADPFPWTQDGEPWLFLEQFRYSRNRGRLVARRLSGGPVLPVDLAGHGHASFPCVFQDGGQLLMLPETGEDGSLDLYACERFPDRWRRVRVLASGLDAADSVPLRHAGRWWLITSLRAARADAGHRALAIFHTGDLLSGALEPHPVNAERRFVDSPFSFGRNAGPVFADSGGRLLRPIQASRRYYGEALAWTRIDALSPSEFHETPLAAAPDELSALPATRLHHVATHGAWLACDTRDRTP
jgi:hypothetical protein